MQQDCHNYRKKSCAKCCYPQSNKASHQGKLSSNKKWNSKVRYNYHCSQILSLFKQIKLTERNQRIVAKINKAISKIPIILIKIYRYFISPILGNCCRFYPSCSSYALEAINQHGKYGIWLAIKRILRCNPFSQGGYDPVTVKNAEKPCLQHL